MDKQAYAQQAERLASQHLTRRFKLTEILDYTKEPTSLEKDKGLVSSGSPDRAAST